MLSNSSYQGSYNDDYFICAYVKQPNGHIDGNILGFIRLRLKKNSEKAFEYVDEIQHCALVRASCIWSDASNIYVSY